MTSRVAIITARGGSKRIPRKNIKNFCGQPIIFYPIKAALESNLFDEVMVSTDDEEIAEISKGLGAKVPFMRSQENSDHFATTISVLKEVIGEYEKRGKNFEEFCCLYPTAPFVTTETLNQAFQKFHRGNFDFLMPIVRFSFPIQRALKIEDNRLSVLNPETVSVRSQDLIPAFHDAGQFYIGNSKALFQVNHFLDGRVGYLERNSLAVQDLDTFEDWDLAEVKYQLLKEKNFTVKSFI